MGEESYKTFPAQWSENANLLINDHYSDFFQENDLLCETYAFQFSSESVVVFSLLPTGKDRSLSPISICISYDHQKDERPKDLSKKLDELVNLAGLVIEDYSKTLENPEEGPYFAQWTKQDLKGHEFYVKVSREDISLTLQAEEILKKGGPI